jgi:hypothetical protein
MASPNNDSIFMAFFNSDSLVNVLNVAEGVVLGHCSRCVSIISHIASVHCVFFLVCYLVRLSFVVSLHLEMYHMQITGWPGEQFSLFVCLSCPYPHVFNIVTEMNQFEAAEEGNADRLRELLTSNNVDECDQIGRTALHHSVAGNYAECVAYCLKMHANVNMVDGFGWPPLCLSAQFDDGNVARMLLDAGAAVDGRASGSKVTPLSIVINRSPRGCQCVLLLIDRGARLANVEDGVLIPPWVHGYIASRAQIRTAAILMMGIHKYHCTKITGNNDFNVIRLIGKHVWSFRC